MKKGLILPALAFALVAGACDEDEGGAVGVGTTADVRFVNAIGGVTGNLAFTANGSMAGSSLGFGSMSSQCTRINSGNTALAFGTANTGGTGISGTALSTQSQTFVSGGDYTVIATGSVTNPQFVVLNNDAYTGSVASGQAAVRFVNLVPTVGGTASNFNVYSGTTTTGTPTAGSLAFAGTSNFSTTNAGSAVYTYTNASGGAQVFSGTGLTLQSGSVNTIAILPNATGTGYQLINIGGC